jgi:hypothetical protein
MHSKNRTDGCLNGVLCTLRASTAKAAIVQPLRESLLGHPTPSKKAADEVYPPLSLDFVAHLAQHS